MLDAGGFVVVFQVGAWYVIEAGIDFTCTVFLSLLTCVIIVSTPFQVCCRFHMLRLLFLWVLLFSFSFFFFFEEVGVRITAAAISISFGTAVVFADVAFASVIVTVVMVMAVDDLTGYFFFFRFNWVHTSSLLGWSSVSGFELILFSAVVDSAAIAVFVVAPVVAPVVAVVIF